MIFYTLKGPAYTLEIHDDHIRLIKKSWFMLLSGRQQVKRWPIHTLSDIQLSSPHFIWMGKLEWQLADGSKASFRFTTHSNMVKKIVLYLQKQITKNHQRSASVPSGDIEQKSFINVA